MAPTTKTTDGSESDQPEDPTTAHEPVTQSASLVGTTTADRCAVCGTRLAGDQRYCLECGERRGSARFSATPSTSAPRQRSLPSGRSRRARMGGGSTLIAGVGTLLLAMGIGVLIGRSGTSAPQPNSSKVQVVTVGSSGSSGGPAAASTTSAAASAPTGSAHSSRSHKTATTKRPRAAVTAPATHPVKKLPPPTVTVGAAGHGPGYSHGHFTGTFFGP